MRLNASNVIISVTYAPATLNAKLAKSVMASEYISILVIIPARFARKAAFLVIRERLALDVHLDTLSAMESAQLVRF